MAGRSSNGPTPALRLVGAVAVIATVALAACGQGTSNSETSAELVRVTDGPADRNTSAPDDRAPASTTASTASTTTPSTAAVTPDLIVADATPWNPATSAVRIVPYRDGFVHLRSNEGVVTVAVSDDGSSWRDIESEPTLRGLPSLVSSNGRRIAVLVAAVEGNEEPTPWVSEDGGATWKAVPLPSMTTSTKKFVTSEFSIGSIALSERAMAIVGQVQDRVDWAAYANEVLGEDHGHVTGEGGSAAGWTVSFEDGFEMAVDLASADLPMPMPPESASVLTHDGASWLEPTELRLTGPDLNSPPIVSGPAGFVVRTGAEAFVSADGTTWKAHPLPELDGAGIGFGFGLVGGPLGYVLVDTDVLYHSLDAIEWTKVDEFEDHDPPETVSQPTTNPSAGGAGFVVPILDGMGSSPTATYLWSKNGIDWSQQSLPSGVEFVDSAVSDSRALVVPFLAPDRTASMPTLPASEADLAGAIARAFHRDEVVDAEGRVVWKNRVTASEAACIADGLVEAVGADRLRELRFGAFPFTLLGYGLTLSIELEEANVIADVLRSCSPSWELLMITSATQGTDWISDDSAVCVQEKLDDDVAAEIFAIELARPYDDEPNAGAPDLSHLEPMIAAFDHCLTPQELNAIDWN